jgi:hypothetical protein
MTSIPPTPPADQPPPRYTLPIAPAWTGDAAAYGAALDRWCAELERLGRDADWRPWYQRTHCPPPPPAARAKNAYDEAGERWDALLRDHWRLLRGDGAGTSRMPPPLGGEQLRRAVATLLSPQARPLLRELLLDLLGDDITDIALAAAQEVHRAR